MFCTLGQAWEEAGVLVDEHKVRFAAWDAGILVNQHVFLFVCVCVCAGMIPTKLA